MPTDYEGSEAQAFARSVAEAAKRDLVRGAEGSESGVPVISGHTGASGSGTRAGEGERFVFDWCRGSTQHDACPRRTVVAGMVVAICSCTCHDGAIGPDSPQ